MKNKWISKTKKIVAREFLLLVGSVLMYFIISLIFPISEMKSRLNMDPEIQIFTLIIFVVFLLRYLYYPIKWRINELKK